MWKTEICLQLSRAICCEKGLKLAEMEEKKNDAREHNQQFGSFI